MTQRDVVPAVSFYVILGDIAGHGVTQRGIVPVVPCSVIIGNMKGHSVAQCPTNDHLGISSDLVSIGIAQYILIHMWF